MSRLPTLFVSHGSPMHALQPGALGEAWAGMVRDLPAPRALLMISAHWETAQPQLTGASLPATLHDFHGFPAPLYALRYPAPGAPEIAERARALLCERGFEAGVDRARGLDHGAWSPLLHMYPQAQHAVVQLSVQPQRGPGHALEIGRALAPLPDEGVLVIGSGHLTHNLRDWMQSWRGTPAGPAGYATQFQEWVRARVAGRQWQELADYRARAPHAVRAHPTEEHFLPLFCAIGAAGEDAVGSRVVADIEAGVLAMDAYRFAAPN